MNLLIIPGNSLPNKDEAYKMKDLLTSFFDEIEIIDYAHWETGEQILNFELELDSVKKISQEKNFDIVLGKSVGVTLAAKAIKLGYLNPKKCIFIGSSLPWAQNQGFDPDSWLENFSVPTLFVQQTNDRTMSHTDLERYIANHNISNSKLIEVPGEDHMYAADEELKKNIEIFLQK